MAAPQCRGCVTERRPGAYGGDESRLVVAALQSQQLEECGAADDAVDGEAGVALEFAQSLHRGVAEDPVDPSRVEAQRAQALLQLRHVVTPQHRGAAVEEAVTHPETGFHQGVPGLRAADTVDAQTTEALERLECGPRTGSEDAVGLDGCAGQNGGQAMLDVEDRVTAVPDGERQPYR
jgi:hypothetical protein